MTDDEWLYFRLTCLNDHNVYIPDTPEQRSLYDAAVGGSGRPSAVLETPSREAPPTSPEAPREARGALEGQVQPVSSKAQPKESLAEIMMRGASRKSGGTK